MAFNFGSMVSGFAEREVEKTDRERKTALDLAKSTLDYRSQLAMENRKKRQARISNDVRLGRNLMSNYGFNKAQVGALIQQGELENVYTKMQEYEQDPNNKGRELPSPDTIVKLNIEKPINMDFEQYVDSLYTTAPAAPEAMKAYGQNQKKRGFFDRDAGRDAREYSQQYAQQIGMDLNEMTDLAFQGELSPDAGFRGKDVSVNLSSLTPNSDPKDLSTYQNRVSKRIGQVITSGLGLEQKWDLAGQYVNRATEAAADRFVIAAMNGASTWAARQIADPDSPFYRREDAALEEALRRVQTQEGAQAYAKDIGYRGPMMDYTDINIDGGVDSGSSGLLRTYKVPDSLLNSMRSATTVAELSGIIKGIEDPDAQEAFLSAIIDAGSTIEGAKKALFGSDGVGVPAPAPEPKENPAPVATAGLEDTNLYTVTPEELAMGLREAGIDLGDYEAVKSSITTMAEQVNQQAIDSGFGSVGYSPSDVSTLIGQVMNAKPMAVDSPTVSPVTSTSGMPDPSNYGL